MTGLLTQLPLRDGDEMHALAKRLWPICRSLTGPGVRETLAILQSEIPGLAIFEVPTGTPCFDWTVPSEWSIEEAYIEGPDGARIVDFADNNLHVVSYSVPVDARMDLDALQPHLHSLPDQCDAIPYVTSYYSKNWGFCLSQRQRDALPPGEYRACIRSALVPGALSYGELIIPGETTQEVFLSTYICHPSMANNELSGPVVATQLARWLAGSGPRHFTYRIIFVPETIGALVYLSRNLSVLKARVAAAFNLTCLGDERCYSFLPSRDGNTLSDRVARHVLKWTDPDYRSYSFLQRGSDERQYCAPGVDLPVASVMRSKYGEYPEYHTSLDDLSLVTPAGLAGGFLALRRCVEIIEGNRIFCATVLGEPQMGPRGLYGGVGGRPVEDENLRRIDVFMYCDGRHSLLEISEILGLPAWDVMAYGAELASHGLIREVAHIGMNE